MTALTEQEFRVKSDEAIEQARRALMALADQEGFEIEMQDGVLNLLFEEPSDARFVVSPNAPVRQIWVSAMARSYKLSWAPNAAPLRSTPRRCRSSSIGSRARIFTAQIREGHETSRAGNSRIDTPDERVIRPASTAAARRSPGRQSHSTRSVVMGRHGMIATSQPLASAAGLKVLQDGGNAIDAAVAAAAVLAVVEPTMTGIGGDLFAIVYDAKTKTLRGLNASGRSAYAATPEAFAARRLATIPASGVYSVTVPGVVDGWDALLSAYGTMPLSRLLVPAIDYAANGYAVSEIISGQWEGAAGKLAADPAAARTFLPRGRAPRPGEIFANPNLAATLQQIASGGRDAFYKGPIARAIVADMKKRDGLLDERDFAEHKADWVEPISTTYRGYDVYEMPPNTQGFVVLEMLNILEGFDLKSLGHNSAEYLHLLVEAKRIAFADRAAYLADPDFVPPAVLRTLISKEYAAARRKEINPARAGRVTARHDRRRRVQHESWRAGREPDRPRSRRHDLHDGRRRQGQRRVADPVALLGLRIRHRRRRHRHRAAQPRRAVQSPSPAIPIASRRTSGRCTRSSRRSS